MIPVDRIARFWTLCMVTNMVPTASGNLWSHGPEDEEQRWVRSIQVIQIPAAPELRGTRHMHYSVPEMRAYGWGDMQ